ncbi:MAG: hypothetical protein AAF423_07935 [Pseudomonadota bacterium]
MSEYFDSLETRGREEREKELFDDIAGKIEDVMERLPGWRDRFAGIDVSAVKDRESFAALPVLRKPELMEAQAENPPFGQFVDTGQINGCRIFMSPGRSKPCAARARRRKRACSCGCLISIMVILVA